VRCGLPAADAPRVRAFLERLAGTHCTVIGERLPAPAWTSVPSAVDDALSQRARAAFDPHAILNPGILGSEAA